MDSSSMDNEDTKQAARRVAFAQLDQVNSDFALAMALQEQERAFTTLSSIESDGDDDESISSCDDDPFFASPEVEAELEFLEGESSNTEMEMEEDEIDPDELSYEELMALGEIVGEESRGLSAEQISACLCPYICYSVECKTGIDRCVICQVEYGEGEKVVALSCQHPYHLDCISKWLQVKKTCPICSNEVSPPKIARTS
ncbi:hypothetical protein L1049_027021 [Liquidambar formosana]|uniref:RING-type domain-containing protein n=1 Tax=Liquidambar formosana TaxID=63359 RepID=A0AAP0NGJ7_LIQFO